MSQAEIQWHYAGSGGATGPITRASILDMVLRREIGLETLVWREGMLNWTRLAETDELRDLLKAVPPPLPQRSVSERDDGEDFFASLDGPSRRFPATPARRPWNVMKAAVWGAIFGLVYAAFQQFEDRSGDPIERFVGELIGSLVGGALMFGIIAIIRNRAGRPR